MTSKNRVKSHPPPSTRVRGTFCFIDLEGFTAHTEAHGDEEAAALATRFAKLTRSALGPGDHLVKTIGDAVLVTSPNGSSAIAMIERLLTRTSKDPDFPAIRAGLHHGAAVQSDEDVFGAAVNLAARVAGEANAGEVLGTEPIAEAARACGIPVAELGPVPLKNVRGTIPLFSLGLMIGATETPIDPVCRVPLDRRSAAGRLLYRGDEYWFCSLSCAAAFASNPAWHTAEARRP